MIKSTGGPLATRLLESGQVTGLISGLVDLALLGLLELLLSSKSFGLCSSLDCLGFRFSVSDR
jgi:hypothetical protein